MAPIPGKEIKSSDQVPPSEYVRRHADIITMAVGLIIHGDQADQILRNKQADLIAVGREILNNPNWPMDARSNSAWRAGFVMFHRRSASGSAPLPSAASGPGRRPGRTGFTNPTSHDDRTVMDRWAGGLDPTKKPLCGAPVGMRRPIVAKHYRRP
ncbi:hypothetical protein ACFFWD_19740 [Bradyrhizobium erythrophlei]|uniref:oxidoreductase n=1 Tax=Bradyrhizobium erythrophlei TaxID=1437360 RepID=UPI0035E6C24B